MKIAFLTHHDPHHRRSWSGTLFYMHRALERHCGQVVSLGPVGRGWSSTRKMVRRAARVLFQQTIDDLHTIVLSKAWASLFQRRLATSRADIVFAPVASTEIAFLKTELPVVYFSDLTARLYRDYFGDLTDLSSWSIEQTETLECRALRRADHVVYCSDWAARSAIQDYGVPAEKVSVFALGANLDEVPTKDEIAAARNRQQADNCRLLFIGVDWERKGGDLALEATRELCSRGINATLTVVGCAPQDIGDENLQVIPFLDKGIPEQRQRLNRLLLDSHFMVFPTRRDASPIVCCEASAFGLPSIVPDVGGLSVWHGQNGLKLCANAPAVEYANAIQSLWDNPHSYRELARSARRLYDDRLNWDAWGRSMADVFNGLLHRATA
jgi:glycosyltransferase involved in cell wall biosynthesis